MAAQVTARPGKGLPLRLGYFREKINGGGRRTEAVAAGRIIILAEFYTAALATMKIEFWRETGGQSRGSKLI